MRLPSPSLSFCAKIAFPLTYQAIFTYFLHLTLSPTPRLMAGVLLLAIVGMPLTAAWNHASCSVGPDEARQGNGHPLFATLVLPLLQLAWLSLG